MARSDELMKGFQLGYSNAPFSALGNAIKSTLGRLTQREDLTSGLATKAGIEQMFADPNERLLKKAQLDKTRLESAGLSDYYGFDSGSGGPETEGVGSTKPSVFGRRPAKTAEEALSLIPETERGDYTTEISYTKGPLGLDETTYKPVLTEEAKARKSKAGTMGAEANFKTEEWGRELTNYLAYDDLIHKNRPKVQDKSTISALTAKGAYGMKIFGEKLGGTTERGRAARQIENQKARIGLKLVRQAGDVGNIRVDERKAQETLLTNQWDSYEDAETKRQYLTNLAIAAKNRDVNTIVSILTSLGVGMGDAATDSPTSPFNPQSPLYKGGDTQQKQGLTAQNITVISPDGTEGTIPMEDLDEALSQGYRRS